MRMLTGTLGALIGTATALAQSPPAAAPDLGEITLTGCFYEESGSGPPDSVRGTQTAHYVLRDVRRVPDGGTAAARGGDTARVGGARTDDAVGTDGTEDRVTGGDAARVGSSLPAGTPVATSGGRVPGGEAARPAGASGAAFDAARDDELPILIADATEGRAFLGQRVQVRGRMSPATDDGTQTATERGGDPDRPIRQFQAVDISPLAGDCSEAGKAGL